MSTEQNIKLLRSYYTPLLNTLSWEENMMLNYKLSIKPLKDLSNKKLSSLFFMKKDQVLSFKLSKKWIFWISLILYLKKVKIWFLKISMSLNSSIMMINIYLLHLLIIINIEDLSLSLLVKKMLSGLFFLKLSQSELLLGLS
jgi:hypothetical protein